jgi:hypothetical protein
MITPEKGPQTRVVSKRNEINFVDEGQLRCFAPVDLRDRA